MAVVDLIMPKLGESIMEATILKWMKQPGDTVEMDETRDRLEAMALRQLERTMPLETDPLKLTRIAVALNQMTRRTKGETLRPVAQQVTVTNINLPASFLNQQQNLHNSIVLNGQSEVVAIGDQTVAPATRAQIMTMQEAATPKQPQELVVEDI